MKTTPITFLNRVGYSLAGYLDTPDDRKPKAFALFAHCFTCGKDLKPFANMNRAMTENGYAVMRFDFAGLGASEGDFSESNLTSNVGDLVDAVQYLESNFEAPRVLIGHSMGGSAILRSAQHVQSAKAIVLIATPANPGHLGKTLSKARQKADASGNAEVSIGGQRFVLKKQFFADLDGSQTAGTMKDLGRPLLILHSPLDSTVDIENAAVLFKRAQHPKSFVSLDTADHLMLEERDARYAGEVISAWADRYV